MFRSHAIKVTPAGKDQELPESSNNPLKGERVPTQQNVEVHMKAIDANRYATKKTISQGMLDIALLTANASQLKHVLQVGEQHEFYKLMIVLISLSIVLQVMSGVLDLSLSCFHDRHINNPASRKPADVINHIRTVFVFLTIMLNLFISIFLSETPVFPYSRQKQNAGVLLMALSLIGMHKSDANRAVAGVLNHLIDGIIFLGVFCDVIKMTFDPWSAPIIVNNPAAETFTAPKK